MLDWVVNNQTYVNVTTTRFKVDQHDVGTFSTALRHTFQASQLLRFDRSIPGQSLQNVNGFADNPSSSQFVRGGLSRFNFNADVTRYGTWHGQHTLKGGFQVERIVDDTLSGEQAATVQLFWDQSYALNDGRRMRGTYGYYNVVRFVTIGDIQHEQRRPVRAGRVDAQPQADAEPRPARPRARTCRRTAQDNPGVHFNFSDKIAPRVGFAYDVQGRQPVEGRTAAGACSTT